MYTQCILQLTASVYSCVLGSNTVVEYFTVPYRTGTVPFLIDTVPFLRIFRKYEKKIQVLLNPNNNNRYFTCRPIYIYDHISLSSCYNEKCFRQKLYTKSKHTFCVQ